MTDDTVTIIINRTSAEDLIADLPTINPCTMIDLEYACLKALGVEDA